VGGQGIAGRVLPVRHYGSVDVFLEAFSRAGAGDVLVIDNGGNPAQLLARAAGRAHTMPSLNPAEPMPNARLKRPRRFSSAMR
jgi:hypothetical protein